MDNSDISVFREPISESRNGSHCCDSSIQATTTNDDMRSPWLLAVYISIYGICIDDVVSLQPLETTKTCPSISRRKALGNSIGVTWTTISTGFVVVATHPDCSMAVAPITQKETETGMAKAMRFVRRSPPKILRQKLKQEFAVLLMRTSYSIVDEIDIVPMNQFQRDFFLIRTAEYEPYIQSLGPGYVKQGDLTDPSYFDFISFAQFLTINRVLSDPAMVFEELQPIPTTSSSSSPAQIRTETTNVSDNDTTLQRFEPILVRRTIMNDQLIPTFRAKFGAAVLQYLDETYRNTPIAITVSRSDANRPSIDAIQASLTQIVKLFLINGFAWDGRVEITPSASFNQWNAAAVVDGAVDVTFCITLDSPASLWGNESLHRQRAMLTNDYMLYVAKEFIEQRTGYTVVSSLVKFQSNSELSYLTIR